MFFITGDTHGEFNRFSTTNFPKQKNLTKSDYLIICGDFGGVWNGDKSEEYWLNWLEEKPFTTLFIDGNHENFDLLYAFPVSEWHGGKVHMIRPSVIHLMRGQVFAIDGRTFFTMGGAASHDMADGVLDPNAPDFKQTLSRFKKQKREFRIKGESWWEQELPSDNEYAEACSNLEKANWQVDYVLSHCAPTSVASGIAEGKQYTPNKLTDFLEEINEKLKVKCTWYFGHYHKDIKKQDRFTAVYEGIYQARFNHKYNLGDCVELQDGSSVCVTGIDYNTKEYLLTSIVAGVVDFGKNSRGLVREVDHTAKKRAFSFPVPRKVQENGVVKMAPEYLYASKELKLDKALYPAIFKRKSIRQFADIPLTTDQLAEIDKVVAKLVPLFPDVKYHIEIKNDGNIAWLCAFCENTTAARMNVGFLMQQADLALHNIGFGRLWCGPEKKPIKTFATDDLSYFICMKIGISTEKLSRKSGKEFDRKPIGEVTTSLEMEKVFEAVRLAPSSNNSQPWFFEYHKKLFNGCIYAMLKRTRSSRRNHMNDVDMGIAFCHAVLALEHSRVRHILILIKPYFGPLLWEDDECVASIEFC